MSAPSIDIGTFAAHATLEGRTLSAVWTGEGDPASLEPLEELLGELHGFAIASKVTDVTVDLRSVTFFSSSCFAKLIGWITRVQELEPSSAYRIRLRSDPGILWQRRGLGVLQSFAPDVVTVDT